MADKQIYELSASGANLLDTALVAGGVGTASATKYTGLQVRAVEKAEREAQDNVIEASVGLNANGSYNTISGSNYLDSSTTIRSALLLLDTVLGTFSSGARANSVSLVADTPQVIALELGGVVTPYADTDYVISSRQGYDSSNYLVPVKITSITANGFTAEAAFDCTYEFITHHL